MDYGECLTRKVLYCCLYHAYYALYDNLKGKGRVGTLRNLYKINLSLFLFLSFCAVCVRKK